MMASVGPTSSFQGSLTPRRKRQPRKLNFLSCTFCRKAKVKCIPIEQEPGAKKCTRCSQKGLACSAPARKTALRDTSMQEGYNNSPPAPIGPNSDIDVHDALALLSLQHILSQAVDELLRIGKQQLMPLKGDSSWFFHGPLLKEAVFCYVSLLEDIQEKLLKYTGEVAQKILRASMDIMGWPKFFHDGCLLHDLDDTVAQYKAQGHHGITTILRMRKLQCSVYDSNANVQNMILDRNTFIDCLDRVLCRHDLDLVLFGHDAVVVDLTKTQLFIPAALFQIPAIAKAIKDDGRRDCLGRPVGHMFHDNKVDKQFRLTEYEDGRDVLGRSRLHIACSLTYSQQVISDLKQAPRFVMGVIQDTMLGLQPLHVAAIHGNVDVFKIALDNSIKSCDQLPLLEHKSISTKRTCLHWAACFGHLDLVDYLLELYDTDNSFQDILTYPDGNRDTPLHVATRNGHLEIVKSISRITDWEKMGRLFLFHTPFWVATRGCHLEIMEFLGPFCDIDERGRELYTPLAEAARQGFHEGVNYLVQLDGVSINPVNKYWKLTEDNVCNGTPLDYAIEGGHQDCINLLRRHGALTYSEIQQRNNQVAQ